MPTVTQSIDNVSRTSFPVMGNTAHVSILGSSAALERFARERLEHLESLWSRFIPTSDISRLNSAGGAPVQVAPETALLVRYMVAGWLLTHGLFDPSMLGELVRSGYSRSFTSEAITVLPTGVEWVRDLASVTVEDDVVTLPVAMALDPGGIGKGLAADLVACELADAGVDGALVSVGGDIRCVGEGDCNGIWVIDIESPFGEDDICSVEFARGAVATSSLTAKMFPDPAANIGEAPRSHILDPRSRRCVDANSRDIVQATVIANECVWAEVFTKAYLVMDAPAGIELASEHGLEAMVVRSDGSTVSSQGWKRFQR